MMMTKKYNPVQTMIAAVAACSLFSLYLLFLKQFFPILGEPEQLIDLAVFSLLLLRMLAMLLIPRFRQSHTLVKTILFTFEIFVVIALIMAFQLTRSSSTLIFSSALFFAWVASSFFVLLPYFIIEFGISLYKGERLLPSLIWGVLLLADLVFAANLALSSRSLPLDLADLGQRVISSAASEPRFVSLVSLSDLVVAGSSVIFYLCMLAYAALSRLDFTRYQGKHMSALLLMLVGNVTLLGWLFLLHGVTTSIVWTLSLPAVVIPVFLLVGFRARKE